MPVGKTCERCGRPVDDRAGMFQWEGHAVCINCRADLGRTTLVVPKPLELIEPITANAPTDVSDVEAKSIQTVTPMLPPTPPAPQTPSLGVSCPFCKGSNVAKASFIWSAGTAQVTGLTTMGFGHGQYGVGVQSGVSQTELARRCAPPESAGSAMWIIALLSLLICFPVGIALFIVSATTSNSAVARARHAEALRSWEAKWVCLQCGGIFINK